MEQWKRGKDAQVGTQLNEQVSGRKDHGKSCVVTVMEWHTSPPSVALTV